MSWSLFFIQTKEERDKQNKLLEEAKKEETKNNIKITPLMPVTAVSPYYDKNRYGQSEYEFLLFLKV